MSGSSCLRVVVEDIGVDAALVGGAGGLLVLRPAQSFQSAVRAVSQCLPLMHPNDVRELVREHLPLSADLDPPVLAPPSQIVTSRHAPVRRHRTIALSFVAGASFALGCVMVVDGLTAPPASELVEDQEWVFSGDGFADFASKMGWACEPAGPLSAHCVDEVGDQVVATLELGNQVLTWTFAQGAGRAQVRWFASRAAMEATSQRLASDGVTLPNLRESGLLWVWGGNELIVDRMLAAAPRAEDLSAAARRVLNDAAEIMVALDF